MLCSDLVRTFKNHPVIKSRLCAFCAHILCRFLRTIYGCMYIVAYVYYICSQHFFPSRLYSHTSPRRSHRRGMAAFDDHNDDAAGNLLPQCTRFWAHTQHTTYILHMLPKNVSFRAVAHGYALLLLYLFKMETICKDNKKKKPHIFGITPNIFHSLV